MYIKIGIISVKFNSVSPLSQGAFTNRSRGPYGEQKLLFESYNFTDRTGPGIDL